MLRRSGVWLVCALALALPSSASSAIFGDGNVRNPTLKLDRTGTALVEYTTEGGVRRHVLVWGAVDGIPHPTESQVGQQRFRMDYSGGWKSRGNARYWRTFKNVCLPYDGPKLAFFVLACRAPDGSYWALQAWQRNLPMRGYEPWTPQQKRVELHVSHWSGELPVLELYNRWTYNRSAQGIFGRLLYQGQPVHGTRTPSARVRDKWARNVSIDTFNSDYGVGWRHDTAIATHVRNGGFCYSFVPQPPPASYPDPRPRGNGLGELHAVSVIGPGVTPIVQAVIPRLHGFDETAQAAATRTFDAILGDDKVCARER